MRAILADAAYGLRLIRTAPSFAVLTIATLAPGIGATTAMFSVVDGVLLKRLPVQDQDRLLIVWTSIASTTSDGRDVQRCSRSSVVRNISSNAARSNVAGISDTRARSGPGP